MRAITLADKIAMILKEAENYLNKIKNGSEILNMGQGFGGLDSDTEIKADRLMGEFLLKKIIDHIGAGKVSIEGFDDYYSGGDLWFCIDPLDGSLNYMLKGKTYGLPHCCVITVLRKIDNAKFRHIVAAGVIDLRSADLWMAFKAGNSYKTLFNGQEIYTSSIDLFDLRSSVVLADFYYPSNREKVVRAFAGRRGWLRNTGSAAYEMACVASGQAAAYICDKQKQHELGAGYALVSGAGGLAINFDGQDLSSKPFVFNAQTPVILAANHEVAHVCLHLLREVD